MKQFCVYFVTDHSRTLYIGVSGNLKERIRQHREKLVDGFTKKYNIDK